MLELFLILSIGVLLRSLVLFRHKWVGIDTLHTLIYALNIKKTRKLCNKDKKMIYPNKKFESIFRYYPPLFSLIISPFKKEHHSKLRFLPPLIDIVTAALVYFFVESALGQTPALIASAVYIISPIVILSTQSIGSRSFANLIFSLSIMMIFMYFSTGNLVFMILFVLANSLILMSHKLTTQGLVIVTVVESIVFGNFVPVVFLILSFILTYVSTGGIYGNVLKYHWINMKRHLLGGDFKHGKIRPENPIKLFVSFPFLAIIILHTIMFGFGELMFFQVWFYSLLFISFFWLWGEAYRYLTNAVFAGAILTTSFYQLLPFGELILISLFAVSLLGISYTTFKFLKSRDGKVISSDTMKCYEYVKDASKNTDVILTMPSSLCRSAYYFCDLSTIFSPTNEEVETAVKTGKIGRYKVTWIVSNSPIKSDKFVRKYSSNGATVYRLKSR